MKKTLITASLLFLLACPVYAEENNTNNAENNLEDLADRLNVIKPQQYIEMTQPVKDYAHETAKKLTPQEIALINSAQKRLNRDLARRQEKPEQPLIKLDSQNKQQIEDFLTPPMYTYDDIQQ